MKSAVKKIGLFLFILLLQSAGHAQDTPVIIIHAQTDELQYSLYPNFYDTHDVGADTRWVAKNDSAITACITQNGSQMLQQLSALSGCTWPESTIDLFLVRYYPTPGSADPLILPIGAIKNGDADIAAPTGDELMVDLLFQLAKRLLLTGAPNTVKDHPLLEKDPYYVDNLAMLLARSVGLQLSDGTAIQTALDSPFWRRFWTGRSIYSKYLAGKWVLSADKPLVTYLKTEPTDSDFSRAAKIEAAAQSTRQVASPDLAPDSRIGMALTDDGSRRLLVAAVDEMKIAYLCGVRSGDRIISISGQQPKTVREAIELVLKRLDTGGSTIEIVRSGTTRSFVLRPRTVSTATKSTN